MKAQYARLLVSARDPVLWALAAGLRRLQGHRIRKANRVSPALAALEKVVGHTTAPLPTLRLLGLQGPREEAFWVSCARAFASTNSPTVREEQLATLFERFDLRSLRALHTHCKAYPRHTPILQRSIVWPLTGLACVAVLDKADSWYGEVLADVHSSAIEQGWDVAVMDRISEFGWHGVVRDRAHNSIDEISALAVEHASLGRQRDNALAEALRGWLLNVCLETQMAAFKILATDREAIGLLMALPTENRNDGSRQCAFSDTTRPRICGLIEHLLSHTPGSRDWSVLRDQVSRFMFESLAFGAVQEVANQLPPRQALTAALSVEIQRHTAFANALLSTHEGLVHRLVAQSRHSVGSTWDAGDTAAVARTAIYSALCRYSQATSASFATFACGQLRFAGKRDRARMLSAVSAGHLELARARRARLLVKSSDLPEQEAIKKAAIEMGTTPAEIVALLDIPSQSAILSLDAESVEGAENHELIAAPSSPLDTMPAAEERETFEEIAEILRAMPLRQQFALVYKFGSGPVRNCLEERYADQRTKELVNETLALIKNSTFNRFSLTLSRSCQRPEPSGRRGSNYATSPEVELAQDHEFP